jgi:hypothetical protein
MPDPAHDHFIWFKELPWKLSHIFYIYKHFLQLKLKCLSATASRTIVTLMWQVMTFIVHTISPFNTKKKTSKILRWPLSNQAKHSQTSKVALQLLCFLTFPFNQWEHDFKLGHPYFSNETCHSRHEVWGNWNLNATNKNKCLLLQLRSQTYSRQLW